MYGQFAFKYLSRPVNANFKFLRNIHSSYRLQALKPILMPALTPTMESGRIVRWHYKEGDLVKASEPMCEVETDKALMDLDLSDDVILLKILQGEGSGSIPLGGLLAWCADKGDDVSKIKIPEDPAEIKTLISRYSPFGDKTEAEPNSNVETAPPSSSATPPPATSPSSRGDEKFHYKAPPSVRALIDKYNIDPSTIHPTGPRGIIQKSDVMEAVERSKAADASRKESKSTAYETVTKSDAASGPSEFVDIPVSTVRGIVASRLSLSKRSIPHSYCSIDCHMDNVLKVKDMLKKSNIKVTVNDFIVKAVSMALRVVPEMNATFENGKVNQKSNVDIAVAVSIPDGLITPVVRNADKLTITQVSGAIQKLAERAKNRKLLPEEFQGSSFTISNLGMFGIHNFTAVINPPEVGILAVGASRRLLSPADQTSVTNVMNTSLSYDVRGINSDTACRFMKFFKFFIESPQFLDVPVANANN